MKWRTMNYQNQSGGGRMMNKKMKGVEMIVWLDFPNKLKEDTYKEYYFEATSDEVEMISKNLTDDMILRLVTPRQHLLKSAKRTRVTITDWLKALKYIEKGANNE